MLEQAGGTKEQIQKAAENAHGIGLFIRSLVGLERAAVIAAFSRFVSDSNATPDQIEFIELIIQELTENGVMKAARLYESPFIDISIRQGQRACFRRPLWISFSMPWLKLRRWRWVNCFFISETGLGEWRETGI